ncbi:late exocytosis, associated with Golgi transport-domain-containing protein, partial [Ochromonadaceae sp. CCMP2298]
MTGNIMRQEQDRVNHLVAEMEDNNASPTEQLVSTLLINVLLFVLLTATFELLRRKKSIYLNRRVSRFIESTPLPRVPPNPDSYPFAWVRLLNDVTDQDILDMVGLDGYICMRYIGICLRTALFCSFFGLSTLVPIYAHSGNELTGWDRYTVANVAEGRHASRLWATALSCYLFAGFFCHLMFQEYKNFIIKRVQYLVQGDNDTPVQTYYTAMVERVPSQLRSGPMLGAFFEHLFPGEFHCAEVAIELHDLEQLTAQRKRKRSTLEKSIALCNADKARPTVWKKAADLHFGPLGSMKAVAENRLADRLGLVVVDAIEYHMKRLSVMNAQVAALRTEYLAQREYLDKEEEARVQQMRLIKKKGRTAWSALKARVTPKSLHKSTLVLARPLSGSGSEPSTTPVNSPTP